MPITCFSAKRQSAAFVDGFLQGSERVAVVEHLRQCESCSVYFEHQATLRSDLRRLPHPVVPPSLTMALRVVASRERASFNRSEGSRWRDLLEQWRFRLQQLMRPIALPAAGGLLSSFVLFSSLVLTISTTTRIVTYDVPVEEGESRLPSNLLPVELRSKSVILTLSFGSDGRIRDYAFGDGDSSTAGDPSILRATNVSLPTLPGVWRFARPTSGDIQISFIPIAYRQ